MPFSPTCVPGILPGLRASVLEWLDKKESGTTVKCAPHQKMVPGLHPGLRASGPPCEKEESEQLKSLHPTL